jgi:D-sedoheptulose 7-phosphate isomerase
VNSSKELSIRIAAAQKLILDSKSFPEDEILHLVNEINSTFRNHKKIAFIGNGGSAAEAMHLAAEFTGKCVNDHPPLHAICLNQSISSITAIANDYGFENIYSRLVEAELNSGDVLIALSTSGRSENILRALNVAVNKGVKCYLWTGENDISIASVNIWKVPSRETPRIQEIHLIWGHVVAELVELTWC